MLRKLKGGIYDDPTRLDILYEIYFTACIYQCLKIYNITGFAKGRDVSYNTDRPKEIQNYKNSRLSLVKRCVLACAV